MAAASTSFGFVPAMNRRAWPIALRRAAMARARPAIERGRGHGQAQPRGRGQVLAARRRKYSCRCRVTASLVASIGSTSMKRNICTLTDSSCMAQAMMRSSHQRRSQTVGCDAVAMLEQVATDLLRRPLDVGKLVIGERSCTARTRRRWRCSRGWSGARRRAALGATNSTRCRPILAKSSLAPATSSAAARPAGCGAAAPKRGV